MLLKPIPHLQVKNNLRLPVARDFRQDVSKQPRNGFFPPDCSNEGLIARATLKHSLRDFRAEFHDMVVLIVREFSVYPLQHSGRTLGAGQLFGYQLVRIQEVVAVELFERREMEAVA